MKCRYQKRKLAQSKLSQAASEGGEFVVADLPQRVSAQHFASNRGKQRKLRELLVELCAYALPLLFIFMKWTQGEDGNR
jgi:hypothetical protein